MIRQKTGEGEEGPKKCHNALEPIVVFVRAWASLFSPQASSRVKKAGNSAQARTGSSMHGTLIHLNLWLQLLRCAWQACPKTPRNPIKITCGS